MPTRLFPNCSKQAVSLTGLIYLIIHFDSYFFRYTDEYIAEILQAVKKIAEQFPGNILLSNNMVNGRHTSILKNNIGQYEQSILENETAVKAILGTSNVYFYDVKKLISRTGLSTSL